MVTVWWVGKVEYALSGNNTREDSGVDTHAPQIPDSAPRYVRPSAIASVLCVSTRTVLTMGRDGRLPRPLRLGHRTYLFDKARVNAALARLAAESEQASA